APAAGGAATGVRDGRRECPGPARPVGAVVAGTFYPATRRHPPRAALPGGAGGAASPGRQPGRGPGLPGSRRKLPAFTAQHTRTELGGPSAGTHPAAAGPGECRLEPGRGPQARFSPGPSEPDRTLPGDGFSRPGAEPPANLPETGS